MSELNDNQIQVTAQVERTFTISVEYEDGWKGKPSDIEIKHSIYPWLRDGKDNGSLYTEGHQGRWYVVQISA